MARMVRAPLLVRRSLEIGLITEAQAQAYLDNYHYFRRQRPITYALHQGKWVASVNKKIYVADTDAKLHALIAKEPDWQRAYIRYVGGLI